MAKAFDATLNGLIDLRPGDWAAFLAARVGAPPGPAAVMDTDLSVTAQADKVFRLGGPPPTLIHLELQADSRLGLPLRLLRYNVLLAHDHPDADVRSVAVLLRPRANASDLTGVYASRAIEFRYAVVRVWEESFDALLGSGPGTAPLAMLTDEAAADLPAALGRFRDRLRGPDVGPTLAGELLGATFVLCGLRHDPVRVADLYRGLSMTLEDSAAYQWILQKGRAEGVAQGAVQEVRRVLLLLGAKRFGQPKPPIEQRVHAVDDPGLLERMAARVLDAVDWDDVLATS